jgi:uncharacterized protein YgbK (DUF1537 family)
MPEAIIIADDLTGAADTGVVFARCGYRTVVVWDKQPPSLTDVLVITTESRHISPEHAAVKVVTVASRLSDKCGSALIYKKIDSTLRGHPAEELAAVMDGFNITKALVAPAFPAQGRTTVSGLHYVSGIPLDRTSFSDEVQTSDVQQLASKLREYTSQRIIWVADAQSMEDLIVLAKAGRMAGLRLFCGSAGLGAALAQTMPKKGKELRPGRFRVDGHWIMGVVASRRENTLQQIEYAEGKGIPIVCPDKDWFLNSTVSALPVVGNLLNGLSSLGMAMLTAHKLPDLPGKSALICLRLAEVVTEFVRQSKLAGLVVTGGDMFTALSSQLETQGILLHGEIQSGIAWGQFLGGRIPDCLVASKAGGFGDESALFAAMKFLKYQIS